MNDAARELALRWLDASDWRIVNDGIMGGRSSSEVSNDGSAWVFRGELSLDNGGGFVSVRRPVAPPGARQTGILVRARGDGRSYQLRLRPGRQFDGVSWAAAFPTGEDWQRHWLPFDEFRPVFRGRPVPSAGQLPLADIAQLSVLLADRDAGRFRVEIDALEYQSM